MVTTSFAGLPLLTELAHHTGLVAALDSLPGLWKRRGAYKTSDYILGLALTLIAGGEGLDDTRVLKGDGGLGRLAFSGLPAANSFGEFLRRFGQRGLARLGDIVSRQGLRCLKPGQTVTLDIDSSVIESNKKEAKRSYKGVDGYNPLLAWIDELDVFMGGVFREGNASPQSHVLSLLRYCRRRLSGVKLRLRSDSAAYQLKVMEYCHKQGIEFAIRADLDAAVRSTIGAIPREAWRLVVRGHDTFLLAETVHAPGQAGNRWQAPLPAFRLVVVRRTGQLDLFRDPVEYYPIIASLPESLSTEEVLGFYNGRGRMEKAIGEAKNGLALHWLPCGELLANAAYFQTVLLAYNLARTLKRIALPESWQGFSIKSLRFRLLCHAGVVIHHARRLILRLSDGFAFFTEFENARWAVLSPS
ncbi:MAG: IS1380 family transposase [Elusimicrobia bacterium]|nr:IS1380 family transposase [Elusimicrobiota bacterium]